MFIHPSLEPPVAISIGPLAIRWYALMYLVGFATAYFLARIRAQDNAIWNKDNVVDLIFYGAWGVLLGGRVGFILFYHMGGFIENPLVLFKVWEGGMSFHGGLIGVILGLWILSRKLNCKFGYVLDFAAPVACIGLAFGRIGNFINAEVWGRETTMPWGVIFLAAGDTPRHPSQLYEGFTEGILLFVILWLYSHKRRYTWSVTGLFLAGYGVARFWMEYYREPDTYLEFIPNDWITWGQILTVPMIIAGIMLFIYAHIKKEYD